MSPSYTRPYTLSEKSELTWTDCSSVSIGANLPVAADAVCREPHLTLRAGRRNELGQCLPQHLNSSQARARAIINPFSVRPRSFPSQSSNVL